MGHFKLHKYIKHAIDDTVSLYFSSKRLVLNPRYQACDKEANYFNVNKSRTPRFLRERQQLFENISNCYFFLGEIKAT